MSTIRLTVPEPCHESRNGNITRLDEQHLHCSTCARTLTDFSQMSDTELSLFFRQSKGKLCGRFSKSQLDRVIKVPAEKPRHRYWMNAIWLLPVIAFAKPAQGQTVTTPHVILHKPDRCVPLQVPQDTKEEMLSVTPKADTLRGEVKDLDNNNEPLKGAVVKLMSKDNKLVEEQTTDAKGNFSFVLPEGAKANEYRIVVSKPGYESAQRLISDAKQLLVIGLMNYSYMMDGVIVIDRD